MSHSSEGAKTQTSKVVMQKILDTVDSRHRAGAAKPTRMTLSDRLASSIAAL
jgi:hypothetical protein